MEISYKKFEEGFDRIQEEMDAMKSELKRYREERDRLTEGDFKTAAYIRSTDTRLLDRLAEMGHEITCRPDKDPDTYECIVASPGFTGQFAGVPEDEFPGIIACSADELELFLALAAMRDGTDMWQWFAVPVLRLGNPSYVCRYNHEKSDKANFRAYAMENYPDDPEYWPRKMNAHELVDYFRSRETRKTTPVYAAVDMDGTERLFGCPPRRSENRWRPQYRQSSHGSSQLVDTDMLVLPQGSLERLAGRKITWFDEPVEI